MKPNVGMLRQQVALEDADSRIVIVSDDESLPDLCILAVYPDFTSEFGQRESVLKIKVQSAKND